MQHQIDHSQIDHSFTAGRQRLVVFTESAILAQPAECAFHNPAFGQDNEAVHLISLNNFNNPAEGLSSPIHKSPGIASINPDSLQPPEATTQLLQHEPTTITVLDVRSVYYHSQDQPESINEDMPFTARNLFPRVITAVPPFSAVLTVWLSRMATLGVGLRPILRRTCSRRRS